jgi:hypothetical protein
MVVAADDERRALRSAQRRRVTIVLLEALGCKPIERR